MEERRKFNRWCIEGEDKTVIECNDAKEVVSLTNVSAGGMKLSFSKPINLGSIVWSEIKVLPNMQPFFIKGEVNRVEEKGNSWEVAIEFDKVSTIPIRE